MNQTSQEVVFPFMFVLGPGISAKASRKVFFVTTIYLLISAWIIGFVHILNSSHHKRVKLAAAPKRGVITIEPLPTTLPVTMALGPINLSLSANVCGALCVYLFSFNSINYP